MSKEEINTFIHPFKPDIRQSMVQLQYILSTGELNQVLFNLLYCFFFFFFTIFFFY